MAHQILREWTLHEEIGHEGVATVYRATHAHMAGEFAVRVIDPEQVPDEEARERFLRRAALAAELVHPNIRRCELPFEEKGVFYAPAERVKGELLSERLDRKPEAWSVDQALDVAAQIAAGLGHAHDKRVVHVGLDPSNVWLEDDGRKVKLGGFGESASRRERAWVREPSMETGGYRAPEVRDGHGPSMAADVYAAGAILYRLLAGTAPADRRLGAVKPDVPRWLDELVARMMAKSPSERPQDGKALAALIASERASSSTAPGYGAGPSASYSARPVDALPADQAALRPKPTSANIVIPLLVVAFLFGVGGLAIGFMASSDPVHGLKRLFGRGDGPAPSPSPSAGDHPRLDPAWLAPLRGRKVWVQVPTPSDTEWCDHFRNAGLIVNCDTDNADQVNYDLIVRCPNLPKDTFEMIEGFLGRAEHPRRYDWREQNKCGEYHEITVEIPIERGAQDEHHEVAGEVAPAVPVKRNGPQFDPEVLAALKGRKVWVQVPTPAESWYCDKFTAAGLVVDCDTDNADQEMYDLIVRCNSLPANTFELLETFLKLPVAARRYDWREENQCGQYHEITVEIPIEREKKAPNMAELPEKTKEGQYDPEVLASVKGRKVWVQVPTPADRAWCDLFENAGLMVTCDTDNADQVKYDLIARCPNLPKDLFQKIEKFVGLDVEARRYDWRNENACGQYHEITVEIPILENGQVKTPEAPAEVAPAVPVKQTDKPFDPEVLAALKGRKVWVQVPGPADAWYCDKFREAGLVVDCDTNNPDQVMYDLIVRCNSLPENTFALIEAYLKLPSEPRRYNWREENACGQYHEITVEIPIARKAKPAGQKGALKASKPGQFDPRTLAKLRGRKVWVQVPGPEDTAWCDLYEKAGLSVTCDTDNADQVKYDLIVRCPNLPQDTFALIEKFNGLKMDARRYDWRRENACGQYHEITVEIPLDMDGAFGAQ